MVKRKVSLEIITPMFMYGAGRRKPELRVPSIKGVMRYFYRAVTPMNVKDLRKEEMKLFGGIVGSNSLKSPVEVFFPEKFELKTKKDYLLPHKNVASFESFKPGQKFDIVISSFNNERLNNFLHYLDLSLLLGGFGKRSRRGFGSLQRKYFNDVSKLKEEIKVTLKDTFKGFNENTVWKSDGEGNFDVLDVFMNDGYSYPIIKQIFVSRFAVANERDALEIIGNATHLNDVDYLGYAKSNGRRFASPVYVSVKKIKEEYVFVATILGSVTKNGEEYKAYIKFIEGLARREQNE